MYEIQELENNLLRQLISELQLRVELPVYEYSLCYVYGSLGLNRKLSLIIADGNPSGVIFHDQKGTGLFGPTEITAELLEFLKKKFPNFYLIRNYLVDTSGKELLRKEWKQNKRSEDEAIYDLKKLLSLEGKEFRNLRRNKRNLLDSNVLIFKKVSGSSQLSDLEIVAGKWFELQGHKYTEDKTNKDISLFKAFLDYGLDCLAYIAYFNQYPVGYILAEPTDNGAVSLVTRGLNQPPGANGVTDALYIKILQDLDKLNIKLVNDGSLGTEPGTRYHKLGYQPINFVDTYEATRL